ncbi:M48 family metallopeptidase [Polaromonas sp. A23]|uniref:M48 family metallopeptidase n=1 Tax=Polaromonas sp. A23 TaxID=1944133 RepID=UPI000986D19B|nr:SprT family zinc-dependent metalloprotease [Polaromonas sp. A23]OOG44020.1 metal-dependent hydrolase [Polaromonas sp. A23]
MQRLLQFTLDLFDLEPASATENTKTSEPKKPPALVSPAPTAIENIANEQNHPPAQTLEQLLAPATYRHPAASREALLEGTVVGYQFRRGKRRTIGFSVGAEGLVVSAPKWVPLYEIDKAVQEKSGWIVKKLQETRARHDRMESARIEWKDGTTLPFLGEQVIVVIDPRHAFGGVGGELKNTAASSAAVLHTGAGAQNTSLPGVAELTLHIALAHDATPEQIRDSVQAWLMRQAKRVFTERLNHFAPHLGVQWRKLSLSSAGTRWGSASADGSIRLNWRLIHFKQSVIDYVVVHELSHLRVMDHSPRFWDTVRTVVPDYAELRSQLKEEALPRW